MPTIDLDKLQSFYACTIVFRKHEIPLINHGVVNRRELQLFFTPWVDLYNKWIEPIPQSFLWHLNYLDSIPILLTDTAWLYALNVKLAIETDLICRNKTPKKPDYPAFINVCISKNGSSWLAYELSSIAYENTFHHFLVNEFRSQLSKRPGDRPERIPDCPNKQCDHYENGANCRNIVGNCAEQRAANDIFSNPASGAYNIFDLDLSPAIRPRTMEIIPPCCNCKAVFPQLS